MTHLDVVPPGPEELWLTHPFIPVVREGKIYGRGVEDNQQELVASLYALKALRELKLPPQYDVGLIFVADEETGSRYGIEYLLKEYPGFRPDDLIIVADGGNPEGTLIEVAEKSILWFRVKVSGCQAHGSRPQQGINAHRIGARFLCRLDELLHNRYPDRDECFEPPASTFEPTKKEPNVPNINTVPGQDVYYFDCRVLPGYSIAEVLNFVRAETQRAAQEFGVKIEVEPVQCAQAAPPTPGDAQVVKALKRAIRAVYGVEAQPKGIGGGTVAAFFRRKGFEAAVWSKIEEAAHKPNEYCVIDNMVNDAKVYAHLFSQK
jgi:succinyl-diaminopimelate desuccinylase